MKLYMCATPLAIALGLTACGDATNTTTDPAKTEKNVQTSSTEPKRKQYVSPLPDDAPIYNVTMEDGTYPPFEFQDSYGVQTGYDVDLIRAIGEEAGFRVQINPIAFSKVLTSLDNGNSDLAVSGLTISQERVSKYLPSDPYINSINTFVVKADSGINSAEDLNGMDVAAQENGFQFNQLKKSGNTNPVAVKTNFLGFQAMLKGKVKAVYADQNMMFYVSEQFGDYPVKFIKDGEMIQLAIFAKKGNQELIDKVNEGLKKIKSNGRYQQINQEWFHTHSQEVAVQ